jgi:hypothetical protein
MKSGAARYGRRISIRTASMGELRNGRKSYRLSAPKVVRDHTRQRFPILVGLLLRLVRRTNTWELAESHDNH